MEMRWRALTTAVAASAVLVAAGAAAAGEHARPAVEPRAQAEGHLLRSAPDNWSLSRLRGFVDPRTGVLMNNTRAACTGIGRRYLRHAYAAFVCVIRPSSRGRVRPLYFSYRVLNGGRARIHLLGPRRSS